MRQLQNFVSNVDATSSSRQNKDVFHLFRRDEDVASTVLQVPQMKVVKCAIASATLACAAFLQAANVEVRAGEPTLPAKFLSGARVLALDAVLTVAPDSALLMPVPTHQPKPIWFSSMRICVEFFCAKVM